VSAGARHPAARRDDPRVVAHQPLQDRGRCRADHGEPRSHGVDALVAIGGEDTLGVATKLHELGVRVVGRAQDDRQRPAGTDFTFGFDTAVNIAMEAIDRLHTTAESTTGCLSSR
jgi:6-phosphofructokinase